MLQLFAEDTNLNKPNAGFRWCVDKDTIERLKQQRVLNPFVLLVVARDRGGYFEETGVKVVPLDQAMEFFEFHAPGRHRVFAKVVWFFGNSAKRDQDQEELYRFFNQFQYKVRESLVDRSGKLNESITKLGNIRMPSDIAFASVDVVVPEGHFAKEPAEWEKWWVNLWFESQPRNRCQFRKRRILAYFFQPVVVLPWLVFKVTATALYTLFWTFFGLRNIEYSAIFHPFRYDFENLGHITQDRTCVFLEDKTGKERSPAFILLMPMAQILSLMLAVLARKIIDLMLGAHSSILWWLLGVNVVVLAVIFFVFSGGLGRLWPEETEEQLLAKRNKDIEGRYAIYNEMMCSTESAKVSVSALPASRQTLYLKFQEFKRKHCLPFAK